MASAYVRLIFGTIHPFMILCTTPLASNISCHDLLSYCLCAGTVLASCNTASNYHPFTLNPAGIKEGLYDMESLASYLLYRLNLQDPIGTFI